MFKTWMSENKVSDFSFLTRLFPKANNREFWGNALNKELVKHAEEYLGCEWPQIRATQYMAFQKSGDRLAQENPHFARRQALLTLFVGELAEHKGRFLPDICDGIFALCEESFWGLAAHIHATDRHFLPDSANHYIDLFAAETAELLSVIYHIMYDEFNEYCPELLERMQYELDRRIIKPYLAHTDFWWMGNDGGRKVNNWNPWIISNILTVFLTANLNRDVFEKGLYKMLNEINHYYEAMPDDGGCDEGCTYWGVAGANLFSFCDQLYVATDGKINFFNDQKLHNIMHYELKAYIGDSYFVNYGDGNAKFRVNSNPNFVYALYGYGLRTDSTEFLKFVANFKRTDKDDDKHLISRGSAKSTLWSLIFANSIAAEDEYTQNSSYILPNLQHAYLRNGQWFCALKGGHNAESHNHNDVGNYMVYCDAEPVIIDAGCGTYTKYTFSSKRYTIWTMQSGYHNLPVINGVEQMNGGAFKADGFEVNGNIAEVSFASAYPETAGACSVKRTVEVTEQGVSVSDEFEFINRNNRVEEHFMTLLKPEITDNGIVLGDKYLLKTDLFKSIEYKSFDGDLKLINAWGCDGVYRIILSAECQKSTSFEFHIRRI